MPGPVLASVCAGLAVTKHLAGPSPGQGTCHHSWSIVTPSTVAVCPANSDPAGLPLAGAPTKIATSSFARTRVIVVPTTGMSSPLGADGSTGSATAGDASIQQLPVTFGEQSIRYHNMSGVMPLTLASCPAVSIPTA